MSRYTSSYPDMRDVRNPPSLSPASLMSDWTSLDAQLGDFSCTNTAFPDMEMSPCSYSSADSSLGYFALPFPVTNTNCLPLGFGLQRSWLGSTASIDNQFMSTLNCGVPPLPSPPMLSPPMLSPPLPSPLVTAYNGATYHDAPTPSPVGGRTPEPTKKASARSQSPKRKPRQTQRQGKRQRTPVKTEPGTTSSPLTLPRPQSNLRTATRAPKRACGSLKRKAEDDESDSESRARHAHNQVELHYRQRLNGYFERLLASLPVRDVNGDGVGSNDEVLFRRKVSKAEVLDIARQRLETLEWRVSTLERENKELIQEKEQMIKALAKRMAGEAE